jgi:hypothetical protein
MTAAPALRSPRLRALAAHGRSPGPDADTEPSERCELCGRAIPDTHRHVLDLESHTVLCACRTCALLFDRRGAGAGRLRLIPDRRLRLEEFVLEDSTWDGLRVPVEMAYFYRDSLRGRTVAFYPGPMGATESRLELDTWEELERANPILTTLEPDVEALLVDRTRGARRYWLVPLEDPLRLVAIIRTRWRGFTGGAEVWQAIDAFLAALDLRAKRAPKGEST